MRGNITYHNVLHKENFSIWRGINFYNLLRITHIYILLKIYAQLCINLWTESAKLKFNRNVNSSNTSAITSG